MHRKPRIVDQHHVLERLGGLDLGERHRRLHVADGGDVDAFPDAGPVGRVRMRFGHDLDQTDDATLLAGVIEEAEIALLHLPHDVPRLVVAHAVPLGALGAFLLLLVPGPGVGL